MHKSGSKKKQEKSIVKSMIDLHEFLWGFSIVSLVVVYFFKGLKKAIFLIMASFKLNSPLSPSSPQPLSLVGHFLHHDHHNNNNNNNNNSFLEKNILQENHENAKSTNHQHKQSSEIIIKKPIFLVSDQGHHQSISSDCSSSTKGSGFGSGRNIKLKKRPARLVLPEICAASLELCDEMGKNNNNNNKLDQIKKEFEVEGRDFVLACKKGSREIMEDGYGFLVDIQGDPKQAFFAVIDGHGGRAAANYVAENLGKNIVKELGNVGEEDHAIRAGYLVTDRGFLSQGVGSGACAASVLLKNGELHVANVGDCRVVLSRNGVADSLTMDHRLSREDERLRIENSGGFVFCRNGVWRVQGSLAVSRAIGDMHLKEWIISEPEIKKLPLTSDCQFLIIASDGLWDKVGEQEAVEMISKDKNSIDSCKKLIEMSSSRGNMDDITVMVINLQQFFNKIIWKSIPTLDT